MLRLGGRFLGGGRRGVAFDVYHGVGDAVAAFLGGLEVHEGVEEAQGYLGLPFVAEHEGLLAGVADEAYLGEHRRHGGLVEHEELGLLHAAVDGAEVVLVLCLNGLREVEALLHVGVLCEGEDDVALFGVGVEAGVVLVGLVVGLEQYVGVLLLGHLEVGAALGEAHDEGLHAGGRAGGVRVGVYADEEVGLVAVGDAGALGERDVDVGGACEDDLHVGVVVLYQLAELLGHGERDVFLPRAAALGSGFGAAVTRVDHHRAHPVGLLFLRKSTAAHKAHYEKYD